MTSYTYNIHFLQKNNTHERDQYISFYEPTHTYTILNDTKSKFTSVTTLIHTLFEQFNADNIIHKMMLSKKWHISKYFGMSSQEIKNIWEVNRVPDVTVLKEVDNLICHHHCAVFFGFFRAGPKVRGRNRTRYANERW